MNRLLVIGVASVDRLHLLCLVLVQTLARNV